MGPFSTLPLYSLILLAPPLLLSLTVHEYAHARTALAFGDPTAKIMGRVTLNPLAHLDLVGTIVLLLTRFIGWAKPVPVNPANLHPRPLGDIAVSLAGPLSNLFLAGFAAVLLRGIWAFMSPSARAGLGSEVPWVLLLLMTTVLANLCLCFFNLIPLFPLDGHHILRELLPGRSQPGFMHWQVRYGRMLLFGLIFLPIVVDRITNTRGQIDPLGFLLNRLIRPAAGFLCGPEITAIFWG